MAQHIDFDFSFGMLGNSPSLHKNLSELTDPKYLPRNQLKAEIFNEYERLFSNIANIIGTISDNRPIGTWLDDISVKLDHLNASAGSTPPIVTAMLSRNGIMPAISRKSRVTESDAYRQVQQEFAFENNSDTSDSIKLTILGGTTFIGATPAFKYTPNYITLDPANSVEVTEHINTIEANTKYIIKLKHNFLHRIGIKIEDISYTVEITDGNNILTEYSNGIQVNLEHGIITINYNDSTNQIRLESPTVRYAYYQERTDGIYLNHDSTANEFIVKPKSPLTEYANGEKALYEVYISPKQSAGQAYPLNTGENIINYIFNEVLENWQIIKVVSTSIEAEEVFKTKNNKILQLTYTGINIVDDTLTLKPGRVIINGRLYNFSSTTITIPNYNITDSIVTVYLNEYNEVLTTTGQTIAALNNPNMIPLLGIRTYYNLPSTNADIIPLCSISEDTNISFRDILNIDGVFGTDTSSVIGWATDNSGDPFLSINNDQIILNDIIINTTQPKYVSDVFENNKTYEINFDNKTLEYKIDEYNGDRDTFNKNSIIRLTRSNFDNNSTINTIAVESIPNIITKKSAPYKTSIISFKYTNQPQTIVFEHNIKGNYLAAVNIFSPDASNQTIEENEVSVACDPNKLTIGITPITSDTITGNNYQRILANITLIEITNDMTTGVTKINEPLQNVTNIFGMPLYTQDYMYYKHLTFHEANRQFSTYDISPNAPFGSVDNYYIKYVNIPDYLLQQTYTGAQTVNTTNYKYPVFLPTFEQITGTDDQLSLHYNKALSFSANKMNKITLTSNLYIGIF